MNDDSAYMHRLVRMRAYMNDDRAYMHRLVS